jgi:hypothetical protein
LRIATTKPGAPALRRAGPLARVADSLQNPKPSLCIASFFRSETLQLSGQNKRTVAPAIRPPDHPEPNNAHHRMQGGFALGKARARISVGTD